MLFFHRSASSSRYHRHGSPCKKKGSTQVLYPEPCSCVREAMKCPHFAAGSGAGTGSRCSAPRSLPKAGRQATRTETRGFHCASLFRRWDPVTAKRSLAGRILRPPAAHSAVAALAVQETRCMHVEGRDEMNGRQTGVKRPIAEYSKAISGSSSSSHGLLVVQVFVTPSGFRNLLKRRA
ncbi:hypothetical protein EI94DRAFT_44256 [Lactarius quietus]|nr:hypothetical protein EI94DRAFT_44256 [Lactarius quietus]